MRLSMPVVAVFVALFMIPGCSTRAPTPPVAGAPASPTDPYPPDGKTDQPATATFSWAASDPGGDSLTAYFYLGTTERPPLLAGGLTDTFHYVPVLDPSQTYSWRVVVRDPAGNMTQSPLWQFTTWDSFVYPLAEGNEWHYSGRVYEFNLRPDTADYEPFGPVDVAMRREIGEPLQPLPGRGAHRIREYRINPEYASDTEGYIYNAETGLFAWGLWRKKDSVANQRPRYHFKGHAFASPRDIFRVATAIASNLVDPVQELAYPLVVGTEWTLVYAGPGARAGKRVIGRESVTTPAGSFDCFVIQRVFDWDGDGVWDEELEYFEWVCERGLVKLSAIARDILITTYDDPYGQAGILVDFAEEMELCALFLVGSLGVVSAGNSYKYTAASRM